MTEEAENNTAGDALEPPEADGPTPAGSDDPSGSAPRRRHAGPADSQSSTLASDPSIDETLPFSGDEAADGELEPGQILGEHYRVEARIGRGAMGAVYVVEHLGLGKRFAAKVVSSSRSSDQNAVRRLRTEARTLSAIEHENIVTVTHLGQTGAGQLFVVMELLEGQDLGHRMSLQQRLADRGEAPPWLPDEEVAEYVPQLLSALTAAHQAQVVHRDLKPDNLFLAEKRGRTVLKVVDFGISKMKQVEDAPSLTQTGQILGTPLYMAPEQGKSTAQVDARADLYSFGCILHEMLTGQPPFVADGVYDCIVKHATEAPTAPSVLRPGLSAELDEIVLRCLQKKPGNRFANAEEILEAFTAAWAHGPSTGEVSGERPKFSPAAESKGDRAETETLDAPAANEIAAAMASQSLDNPAPQKRGGARLWMAGAVVLLLGAAAVYGSSGADSATSDAPTHGPVANPPVTISPPNGPHDTPAGSAVGHAPTAPNPAATDEPDPSGSSPSGAAVTENTAGSDTPTADLDAGATHAVQAAVEVRLRSQPTGATVHLMGENVGHTPLTLSITPGHDLRVEVTRHGYRMRHVTLRAEDPEPGVVYLRRIEPAAPALAPR